MGSEGGVIRDVEVPSLWVSLFRHGALHVRPWAFTLPRQNPVDRCRASGSQVREAEMFLHQEKQLTHSYEYRSYDSTSAK